MSELADNELIRGDSRTFKVRFLDAAGNARDLTGGTVYLTLNRSGDPVDDTSAALQKTITDIENPTSGIVTFKLSTVEAKSLKPGNYWYDAELVDAQGDTISAKRTEITVIPDITRS